MSEFNFKSSVCTSREQSEKLLALGLKKETADMTHHYLHSTDSYELKDIEFSRIMHLQELVNKKPVLGVSGDELYAKDIPAWSLHRMMSMLTAKRKCLLIRVEADLYDVLINRIEHEIKERYFNEEYLV